MSEEIRALMDKAKTHVRANLQQCCKDILEWKHQGVLPAGPVREAGEFLKGPYPYDYIQLTEGFVVRAALEAVAADPAKTGVQAAMQIAYNNLWGGCLCGHFESCSFCDGSMDAPRRALEEQAKALGFALTIPGI